MKWLAIAAASLMCCVVIVPLGLVLVAGGDTGTLPACTGPATLTADGSPTILGGATLTAQQVTAWWVSAHGDSMPIKVDPATFIGWYWQYGAADGVRPDYAFAQSLLETGSFTNQDSLERNNYGGIGNSGGGGIPFASPQDGVIAEIQILKEVATGSNSGPFAEPKVAPNWGGRVATTWYQLGMLNPTDRGYWAGTPAAQYWAGILSWFDKMAAGTPAATPATLVSDNGSTTTSGSAAGGNGCATTGIAGCVPPTAGVTTTTSGVPSAPDPLGPMLAYLCQALVLNTPYVWGGTGPPGSPNGFDCSGLTMMAYEQVGVQLPRTAALQDAYVHAVMVPPDQLQVGELVFFESPVGHVATIVQASVNGALPLMLQAPDTGQVVDITQLWVAQYVGAGMPVLPATAT